MAVKVGAALLALHALVLFGPCCGLPSDTSPLASARGRGLLQRQPRGLAAAPAAGTPPSRPPSVPQTHSAPPTLVQTLGGVTLIFLAERAVWACGTFLLRR